MLFTNNPIPSVINVRQPDALNTAMATKMAIKYGIICIAVVNPSFAPSIKAS